MKNIYFLLFALIFSFYTEGSAQVAITTDGSAPSPKAMLDVKSNNRGMHIPRMTTAERKAIAPTTSDLGLMVFDVDKSRIYMFDGQNWLPLAVGSLYETPLNIRTASDGAPNENFGGSVAIEGDYAVVGSPNAQIGVNALQGAAYIFYRSGNVWTQQAKLIAADGLASQGLGFSVAISGNSVILGSFGAGVAYVFSRSGSTWTQQTKLTVAGDLTLDQFGFCVGISGDYAIVGSPGKPMNSMSGAGAAYIFSRTGSSWTQQAKLDAYDAASGDRFGASVSISGGWAVVGSPNDDIGSNADQGSIYVYSLPINSANLPKKVTALNGAAANNNFGYSVSITTTISPKILVGAPGNDNNRGAAYVLSFFFFGSNWFQDAKLTPSDEELGGKFGLHVSLTGGYALVGNLIANLSLETVYIFSANTSDVGWTEKKKITFPLTSVYTWGTSVGITPNSFILGSNLGNNPITNQPTGAVSFGTIDF